MKNLTAITCATLCLAAALFTWPHASGASVAAAVSYYTDGTIESVGQVNASGQLHGQLRRYSRNGKLEAIGIYSQGGLVTYKTYWPSGRLQSELTEGADYLATEKSYPDE